MDTDSLSRQAASEGVVGALRERIAALETSRRTPTQAEEVVSSGWPSVDRLLPAGGCAWGTLVEWLMASPGSGGEVLVWTMASEAIRAGGSLVVMDGRREFYPPAVARLGVALDRLVVVQASDEADELWALDQALRCEGVAAVVAWPERLDNRWFRRLQLAVEEGGGLGLLVRPGWARVEPSWADARFLVEPVAGSLTPRLRVERVRCRQAGAGAWVEVELDDEHPDLVSKISRVAPATTLRRSARA